jgi:tetratricopeptide (TPR) repeat protein/predicted Ser/Thr protein kinase
VSDSSSSDEATVSGKAVTGPRPSLARGASVGRYLLLDLLGQGGMGVVYKAYDPELDRPIALKLLHTKESEPAQQERLLREAQALARLSHPNVIAVYDVGTFGGSVFIATEFVEGKTVRKWLTEARRERREIVAAFRAAGEGLMAAHRAGLVHRDFKPDNVMIGEDGRVRVLDFGLARAAKAEPTAASEATRPPEAPAAPPMEPDSSWDSQRSGSLLATPLTHAGAITGTPRFMPPEQHRGEAIDERADQFSFCVSLYYALYGGFPFGGESEEDLLANVVAGRIREPPAGSNVPRWLRQVLLKGLQASPADRYPSMAALLEALAKDPSVARGRFLRSAALVVIVGSSFVGWRVAQRREVRACAGAGDKLAGIWDGARRDQIRAAFRRSNKAWAESALTTVERVFDDYARAWVAMRVDACEATHVRREQSQELLDLRMTCLSDRLTQLQTLSELFVSADANTVERAVQSAQSLPGLAPCADAAALRAPMSPPADAETRRRVEDVRQRLSRAHALGLAAHFDEGLHVAHAALADAERLKYAPVEAEAQLRVADLSAEHGDRESGDRALHRAFVAALAGHHDEIATRAAIAAIGAIGLHQAKHEEGDRWADVAEALASRLKSKEELLGALYSSRSLLREEESRYDEALADGQHALELQRRVLGPDNLAVAETYCHLAQIQFYRGEQKEPLDLYERCLAIQKKTLGPDHPRMIRTQVGLANVHGDLGDHERAIAEYESALATLKRVQPDAPFITTIYNNRGTELLAAGRPREAFEDFQRAFVDWQKRIGPSLDTATALLNMADALLTLKQPAEALHYLDQALDTCEHKLETNHAQCGIVFGKIGEAREQLHQLDAALAAFERSVSVTEKTLGEKHSQLSLGLLGIGRVELARHAPARAKAPLERALAILEAQPGDEGGLASVRFTLAQALWATGARPRAIELATSAREIFAKAKEGSRESLAEVTAWLARHRT